MKQFILLPFFTLLIFTNYSFGQQSVNNDDCNGAFPLTVAADESSAFLFIGTTIGATASIVPTTVCSGSWFGDDVWYEFTTDSIVPQNGVTIKVKPILNSPFQGLGMAVYTSCDSAATYINCFSQNGSLDSMSLPFLQTNTNYKIRVWSGGGVTTNSGAYNIIVYENAFNPNLPLDVVLWGDSTGQGDFNGGMNGWTSIVDSVSANSTDNWVWEADAQANGMFRQNIIESPTAYNGAMLFDADFMTTSVNLNPPQPYPQHTAELLSPIIDCTNMPPLSVKFYQSYQALNGDCYFSYSINGGNTFSTPININEDIGGNEGTPEPSIKRFYLPDANESSIVQLKFTADMDFYNWIIDDVQLVEKERNNVALVKDFIAIAPTYAMPETSVDTIRFLANVTNTGVNNATNVVATVNVVRDSDNVTVFTTSHQYGTITSEDTIENQVFNTVYLPDTMANNSYTVTYILSSDSLDVFTYDDTFSYKFEIVQDYFDKAKEINSNIMFNTTSNSYTYGTMYYVLNGKELCPFNNSDTIFRWVSAVSFGVANPVELAGESITIFIEKPLMGNVFTVNPNDGTIGQGDCQLVGFGTYTFTGNEQANTLLSIPIEDFNTGANMSLESNMNYIIAMNYNSSNTTTNLFMSVTEDESLNYQAADYAAAQAGVQRFSKILDEGNTGTYQTRVDAEYGVPYLRMDFYEPWWSTCFTDGVGLDSKILKISPNPAMDFINLNIELEEFTKKATVTIYNINGQIMETRNLSNIKNETILFDLENYESGMYSVLIETKNGHSIKRFVVAK